ncbi:protein HESO1 isoform X2 [Quercus suber]|uniref:protein HESO1 isoform X2 n=1 Tax=Quercus suber TaxID=58331 RepID=UPI0032DE32A8
MKRVSAKLQPSEIKMSAYNTLEHILREVLEVLKTLQEDWVTRSQFIKELRGVIESVESLRGAAVEPFGSFVSNLFTRWSDMDISINLPKGGYISYVENDRKQSLSKKEKKEEKDCKIFLLEDLQKAMLGGRWQMVQLICGRVPILKCKSSHYGFSCDISIDNLESQMKSKLLLWISEIDGRFRDMVLLVKEWAKAHEINDATPISGTFNSYSLCLLVIFHFQNQVPHPVLQSVGKIKTIPNWPPLIIHNRKAMEGAKAQNTYLNIIVFSMSSLIDRKDTCVPGSLSLYANNNFCNF